MITDFSKIKNPQGIIDIAVNILRSKTDNPDAAATISRLRDTKIPFSKRFAEANIIWRTSIKNQLDELADNFEKQVAEMTKKYEEHYCTLSSILKSANNARTFEGISLEDTKEIIRYAVANKIDFESAKQKIDLECTDNSVNIYKAIKDIIDSDNEIHDNLFNAEYFSGIKDKIYNKITVKPANKDEFYKFLDEYFCLK